LAVPERHKPDKQAFSLRPKKIEAWLKSLPMANLGETARLIYHTLNQTNEIDYAYADRIHFLEEMREPVQYATDSMRKHFLGMTFPLPEKNRNIAIATREIYAAMATGYKIVIEDIARTNALLQDKKLLAVQLHRALTYTGHNLLTAYQIYSRYAPHTWQELHKLYAYAESRKLHTTAVSDYQHHYFEKSTLLAEYLRLLLLSLASPYHLRQGEVLNIYNSLERWTRPLELRPLTSKPPSDNKTLFLVRLDRDVPPRPLAYSVIKESHRSEYRILNTEPLTQTLRTEIQNNEEVVSTTLTSFDLSRPDLSHELLRRLLVAWGTETRRNFPRSPKHEQVEVAIGLSDTHSFINQLARRNSTADKNLFEHPAHFESHEVRNNKESQHDVWDMIYETDVSDLESAGIIPLITEELGIQEDALGTHEPNDSSSESGHRQSYRAGSWVILNESATGYCLEYNEESTTRAQVGELIGIRRNQNGQTLKWGIGVIRWLKLSPHKKNEADGKKTLQMGIEMLNPAAAAIGIRPTAASNKPENYQRTLLLPEIRSMHQPATLITSPVPWRPGQHAVINILGKEMPVVLTHAMQNTGLFAQFQFRMDNPEKAETETQEMEDSLSKVWSSI